MNEEQNLNPSGETTEVNPQPNAAAQVATPDKQYDWFKSELSGLNNNLADLYNQGYTPETQFMDTLDNYWSDKEIRKPFEDSFGEKAKDEFSKIYKVSEERLNAYKNHQFDITHASMPVEPFRSRISTRLEDAGKTMISKAPAEAFVKFPQYVDPWGRSFMEYNLATGGYKLSEANFGWREGATKVLDPKTNEFVDVEQYKENNPGVNLVYAANPDGSPKQGSDNLAYLRPLDYGEPKKTYEQYYTDTATIMGSKGLERSDWYALQWLPKNTMNFVADTLDSFSELLKMTDNLWQSEDQSSWDKGLTEFQNDVNSVLYVPTSEEGMSKWYSAEGIADGLAQIGGQLFGMKGVGYATKSLVALSKMGTGQRAGSVASRLWMASLVSDDVAKEGYENGLTPKEIAAVYALYTGMMYKIAGLSDMVVNPANARAVQIQALKPMYQELGKVKQLTNGKLSLPSMYRAVKNATYKVDSGLSSLLTATGAAPRLLGAMAAESTEEMTEVVADKLFKEGYNAIWGPYAGKDIYDELTNKKKDARFKVSWDEIGTELAAAGTLGALGGGLYKTMDLFSNNSPQKRTTLLGYGAIDPSYNGLRKRLEKDWANDRVLPGGKNIDIFGNTTDDVKKSRAYAAYQAIKSEIDMAQSLWKAYDADKAYYKNNQILGDIVRQNYERITQDEADFRLTSLGSDITNRLNKIAELQFQNVNEKTTISNEQAEKNNQEILKLETELRDITSGKNAATYLHEALYNTDLFLGFKAQEGVSEEKRLSFKEFLVLNEQFKNRLKDVSQLRSSLEGVNLDQAIEQGIKIAKDSEPYLKLKDEIDDKYIIDGITPSGEELKKYQEEIAKLDSIVYDKSQDVFDDFYYTLGTDGKKSVSFESIIEELVKQEELSKTGNIVFDDVEKVESAINQIIKRGQQLRGLSEVNPKINTVLSTGNLKSDNPVISVEDAGKVGKKLDEFLGVLEELRRVAVDNKQDPYKAAIIAADKQRKFTGAVVSRIYDYLSSNVLYKDLSDSLSESITLLTASETQKDFEVNLAKIQDAIHNYFKKAPNDAIEAFYRDTEVLYSRPDVQSTSTVKLKETDFTYLKAIVSFEPAKFRSRYVDALSEMMNDTQKSNNNSKAERDMRTPFPAQDRNIYRVAAFLTGAKSSASSVYREPSDINTAPSVAAFTESIFLQDEQGSGKTLVALMGVKIAQLERGGKAAIFAKSDPIRTKAYTEATQKLGITVDTTVDSKNSSWGYAEIMNYLKEGNGEKLKTVKYIVIDEATLYSVQELENIDIFVRRFNEVNNIKDPVRIVLVGDPSQMGAMRPAPDTGFPDEYNIGEQRHIIERSEMTRFSWRTGNLDILDALKQLRLRAAYPNDDGAYVNDILLSYNKKDKRGIMVTDNFDSDFKSVKSGLNEKDYFVITNNTDKKAKLIADGVPAKNIFLPEEVQGQERKYVFVAIDINEKAIGLEANMQYKSVLTAVGRASEMVVLQNHPSFRIKTVDGQSNFKDFVFTDEQFKALRQERIDALNAAGTSNLEPAKQIFDTNVIIPTVREAYDIQGSELSSEEYDAWIKFATSLKPLAGDTLLFSTFYTNGYSVGEDGERTELPVETLTQIKRGITDPSVPLPFGADKIKFVLQYQRNERPTRVVDTLSETLNSEKQNAPKLVLFAKFLKNNNEVADVSFGVITGLGDFKMPLDNGKKVLELTYSDAKSNEILSAIRKDRNRASIDITSPFKESRKAQKSKEERALDKQTIPVLEFMAKNPGHSYASSPFQVTMLSAEKTPYLFYSYVKTSSEIDAILTGMQMSQSAAEEEAIGITGKEEVTSKDIKEASLAVLKDTFQILSMPLNGGKHVPLDTFLEKLSKNWGLSKSKEEIKISDSAREIGLKFIANELNLTDLNLDKNGRVKLDGKAYSQLEKKKFSNEYKKYLLDVVKNHFRDEEADEEESAKNKKSTIQKKKSKEERKVKDGVVVKPLAKSFRFRTFLKSVYEESLKNTKKGEQAKAFLEKLGNQVYKYGVYETTETVRNSTDPRDAGFGKAALNYGYFTVSGAISPGYPVFKLPVSIFNNKDVENAQELEIKKSETIIVPDAPQSPAINNIAAPKTEDGKTPTEFFEERSNSKEIRNDRKIFDIANAWFKGQPNQYYFEEFIKYFSVKISDTVFPLVGDNATGIVTSANIDPVIKELKRQLSEKGKDIKKIFESAPPQLTMEKFTKSFLQSTTNNPNGQLRDIYYDMVLSYEFDSLLKHFFPGVKLEDGKYSFVNTNFSFNPIAESKDEVSHLATGSDFAKMILFNTPVIESKIDSTTKKRVYVSSRRTNKEDYAIIIRDMKDNDITSLSKATAYFNAAGTETPVLGSRKEQIKFSIYQRLLALNPLEINGQKHYSMMTASQRGEGTTEQKALRVKQAANGITALLSFLSSGNEAEYSRIIFNRNKSFDSTGRLTNITANYFRVDLEQALTAKKQVQMIEKEKLGDKYIPLASYNPSKLEVTYNITRGKTKIPITIKGGANPSMSTTATTDKRVDDTLIAQLLQNLGMNKVKQSFISKIPKQTQLIPVLFGIGKYLGSESNDFFEGSSLTEWVNFSETMQTFNDIDSAYQYRLLNGERVNLLSLSYPLVRTNQHIKDIRQTVGESPVKQLDIVKHFGASQDPSKLDFTGYMLKEGFINEDETFMKHNSRLSVKEQVKYDFFHLYLGFLSRNKEANKQTVAFSPISFADKGSASVVKASSNFLPKLGGKVDTAQLKNRTLTSINNYYRQQGIAIVESWRKALLQYGYALPIATPVFESPVSIVNAINGINKLIPTLSLEIRRALVGSNLKNELHYQMKTEKDPVTGQSFRVVGGGIKTSIIDKINDSSLQQYYSEQLKEFKENLSFFGITENSEIPYLEDLKISNQEAIESYFWNWNWVSHNFNKFWIGPEEGYKSNKEYTDAVKRASQVSTNRGRVVTRDENYESLPEALQIIEGGKLAKFSQTAIISDFERKILPVSYTKEVGQKIFDGAAFFNNIFKLQLKRSYGENFGMNVGANLKPISTYMDLETGMPRYDKYASYEITEQMRTDGDPFIRAIDRLMKDSIKYSANGVTGITINGQVVDSLFELENAAKAAGMTDEQILDFMVKNKIQDLYITEVIFDSSVKNGLSNLNQFSTFDDLINAQSLISIPRSNAEFGLVLDATHESNDARARLSSQAISAMLQRPETLGEAENIVKAIEVIGDRNRAEILEKDYFSTIRNKINERGSVGMIQEIVNSQYPSLSNKILLNMSYSALASELSDKTIRFDIFGGQQVLSPATGVWQIVDENGKTRIAKDEDRAKGIARELKGFDAIREDGVSIKETDIWKNLKQIVDQRIATKDPVQRAELRRVEDQLRSELYTELASGRWKVESPEVVISPTHFKAFGIEPGTNIEDINPALFKKLDKERRIRKFSSIKISSPDLLAKYKEAKKNNNQAEIDLIINSIINPEVLQAEKDGVYDRKFAEFEKSLTLLMGRIPGTTPHSITKIKVVGFAHNADNTIYVHPDILVFHGADQDIDKGNLIAYEAENAQINIPTFENGVWSLNGQTIEEDKLTEVQLRNFIADQFIKALDKAESAIVATMPTATDNLDEALENIPEEDASISTANPIANNKLFVRGQGGKTSVGIGAVGMKNYSGMVFSARKREKDYANYIPKSSPLSRNGDFARISFNLEALVTYDEVIQAAVDNAKDPKLGRANINEYTGGLVNALAFHGYTAAEIVSFLRNPIVKGVYDIFTETKDFQNRGKRPKLEDIIEASPYKDSAELNDLRYFNSFAEDLRHVGTIFSINQEIPNNIYSAFALKAAFKQLSPEFSLEEFLTLNEKEKIDVANSFEGGKINIFEILIDNKHMMSYLKSFVDMDAKMLKDSTLYADISKAYESIGEELIRNEDVFNSMTDFVYGFGIDSFLASRGEGSKIVMNGAVYDLANVFTTDDAKGRIAFMKDFPRYFVNLTPKFETTNNGRNNYENNLQEYLIQIPYQDTLVLKPVSNFRDYSAEKKAVVNGLMTDVNNQFTIPDGDSMIKDMLGYYTLIKDKGASTATSFVDMFTYEGSVFEKFDNWIQQNPLRLYSEYFTEGRENDLTMLFKMASNKVYLTKEDRKIEGLADKKKMMSDNRLFIPYGNSITLNDAASSANFEENTNFENEGGSMSDMIDMGDGLFLPRFKANIIKEREAQAKKSRSKTKKQKNYEDFVTRKAVGRNVSAKLVNSFASKMADRFGINVQVLTTAQIAENPQFLPEDATRKGFVKDGVVYINSDLATLDTPIHEFVHVWMAALKAQDPTFYNQIINMSLAHPYAETIRKRYPEEDEEGVAEETFATLTGIYTSEKAFSNYNRSFFGRMKSIFDKFINWVKTTFSNIFGVQISVNDSISEIIDRFGESMMSAMDMSRNDAADLSLLGIRLVSADSELSTLRENLRLQNRYKKVC